MILTFQTRAIRHQRPIPFNTGMEAKMHEKIMADRHVMVEKFRKDPEIWETIVWNHFDVAAYSKNSKYGKIRDFRWKLHKKGPKNRYRPPRSWVSLIGRIFCLNYKIHFWMGTPTSPLWLLENGSVDFDKICRVHSMESEKPIWTSSIPVDRFRVLVSLDFRWIKGEIVPSSHMVRVRACFLDSISHGYEAKRLSVPWHLFSSVYVVATVLSTLEYSYALVCLLMTLGIDLPKIDIFQFFIIGWIFLTCL